MKKFVTALLFTVFGQSLYAQSYAPGELINVNFTDEWGGNYDITFKNECSQSYNVYLEFSIVSFRFNYIDVNGLRYTKQQVQSILNQKGIQWRFNGGEPEAAVFNPDGFTSGLNFKVEGFTYRENGTVLCRNNKDVPFEFYIFGELDPDRIYRIYDHDDLYGVDVFEDCVPGFGEGKIYCGNIVYDYGNSENSALTQLVRGPIIENQLAQREASARVQRARDREINGFFSLGFSGNYYDMARTPGLENKTGEGGAAMLLNLEHVSFLDDERQFGLHYGAWTQLDFMGDGFDRYEVSPFLGVNLFEYFEIDYVFRGLSMSGTASGEDLNTGQTYYRDLGGDALQFHGGLRASAYLARNKDEGTLFRVTFNWVDSRPESPISFLSLGSVDGVQTQNMTIKMEGMHNGILLYLYYSTESYISAETIPYGLDTFGFGLNWTMLWPNRE